MSKDDHLSALIERAFQKDEIISLQSVDVTVTNGLVTLNGTVQVRWYRLLAQEIASSFEGCRQVVNKLTVDPEAPLTDTEVAKNVKCSLNASADVMADGVSVTVIHGIAHLSGGVRSQWERLAAEDITRSIQGIRDVENLLVVDPWPESTMGKSSGK